MLRSIMRSHSSTLRSESGAIGMMPAFLARTSILPYVSMALFTRDSTSARFVASTFTASAFPPLASMALTIASRRSLRRALRTTVAPSFARWQAVLSPSPLLAPVMTTTLPSMFLLIVISLLGRGTAPRNVKGTLVRKPTFGALDEDPERLVGGSLSPAAFNSSLNTLEHPRGHSRRTDLRYQVHQIGDRPCIELLHRTNDLVSQALIRKRLR